MNDELERMVQQAATKSADLSVRLEEVFVDNYRLKDTDKQDTGYMAWGLLGVDVAIRLAKMYIAIRDNKGVYEVACDLTYQLNTNEFWQKNANVLMPLMHMALNAHRDGVMLLAERTARNEYSSNDALISAAKAAPLEIFPVIGYLIGGPSLMVSCSLKLKHDLAPYFLG